MWFTKKLREENRLLRLELEQLKQQQPQLKQFVKFLHDLQIIGGGLLAVTRINPKDMYVWRGDE